MKRLLLFVAFVALLIVPAASASSTVTYPVAAAGSNGSVTYFTTTSPGDFTITLNYRSSGTATVALTDTRNYELLDGLCQSATGPGFFTETCVGAPADKYEVFIFPNHGSLRGTLTVSGALG